MPLAPVFHAAANAARATIGFLAQATILFGLITQPNKLLKGPEPVPEDYKKPEPYVGKE